MAIDKVTSAAIADGAVSADTLTSTAITGQTAETSIADDDLILLSDTSASAALKKMTRSNFVSGLGGTSQIVFTISSGSDTTLADDAETVLSNTYTENFKIGSSMTYSSNIWSFPSTGVYQIHFGMNATVYPGTNQDVGLIDGRIQTTTNNSSYSTLSRAASYINGVRDGTATNVSTFGVFDVTDTSTHKVRFAVYKADNTANATTVGLVHLIFKKIADT